MVPEDVKRDCPRDQRALVELTLQAARSSVTVDECATCGGMFLDPGELRRLAGDAAMERYLASRPRADREGAACPGCGDPMLVQHARDVEVDVCPWCGGIWLDGSELTRLRALEGAALVAKREARRQAKRARRKTEPPARDRVGDLGRADAVGETADVHYYILDGIIDALLATK